MDSRLNFSDFAHFVQIVSEEVPKILFTSIHHNDTYFNKNNFDDQSASNNLSEISISKNEHITAIQLIQSMFPEDCVFQPTVENYVN